MWARRTKAGPEQKEPPSSLASRSVGHVRRIKYGPSRKRIIGAFSRTSALDAFCARKRRSRHEDTRRGRAFLRLTAMSKPRPYRASLPRCLARTQPVLSHPCSAHPQRTSRHLLATSTTSTSCPHWSLAMGRTGSAGRSSNTGTLSRFTTRNLRTASPGRPDAAIARRESRTTSADRPEATAIGATALSAALSC